MMTMGSEVAVTCMAAPEGDNWGRMTIVGIGFIDSVDIRPSAWEAVKEAWQGPGRYIVTVAFWGSPGCWGKSVVAIELVELWLNYRK